MCDCRNLREYHRTSQCDHENAAEIWKKNIHVASELCWLPGEHFRAEDAAFKSEYLFSLITIIRRRRQLISIYLSQQYTTLRIIGSGTKGFAGLADCHLQGLCVLICRFEAEKRKTDAKLSSTVKRSVRCQYLSQSPRTISSVISSVMTPAGNRS